jgi:hypothetical protein
VARAAEVELESLRALPRPPGTDRQPPHASPSSSAWRAGEDPFVEEEREALLRELEQATAARPDLRQRLASELYLRAQRRHEAHECRLAVSDLRRAAGCVQADEAVALAPLERRCRLEVAVQALRRGEGALAAAAVGPVCAGEGTLGALAGQERGDGDEVRRASYLLGRALELLRRPGEARDAFMVTLGGVSVPRDRDLALVRELARLSSAGIVIRN